MSVAARPSSQRPMGNQMRLSSTLKGSTLEEGARLASQRAQNLGAVARGRLEREGAAWAFR
eukprot:6655654-Pyramimonas_sp.AAC.1